MTPVLGLASQPQAPFPRIAGMAKHPPRAQAAADAVQIIDTRLFTALCEPIRVRLVARLVQIGRSDIGAICEGFKQDRSVISRHLRVLKDAGILVAERDGRHVYYEVDGPGVLQRLEAVVEQVRRIEPLCRPARRG